MHLDDSLVPPGMVFVAHDEVKQTVGQKKVLKVYLVDKDGKKHLAATGEDLGDAHYHYRSTKPFSKYGNIDCHNRKELTMWLEMIIAESGCKEGPHLDADEQNPEGVYFTSHKYERAHMPDGRRINRWYLVDQHGSAHLAVIGIERDTKDGHYTYSAEQPFATMIPLQCSNQAGVFKWLEKWITHHAAGAAALAKGQAAGAAAGSATVSEGAAASVLNGTGLDPAGRKPPLFISLSAIRQARKSASALLAENAMVVDPNARAKPKPKQQAAATPGPGMQLGAAQPAGPKQKSLGIVQQNQIKKARKLQEDARAEQDRLITGHLMRLRRAAAAELQGDAAAKQLTMSWLQGGLTGEELEALQHWITLLNAVLDLQKQHQQWQQQQQQQRQGQQTEGAEAGELKPQQKEQMQQQQQQEAAEQPAGTTPAVLPEQQQQGLQQPAQSSSLTAEQQQQQQQQREAAHSSGPGLPTAADGAVMTDKELLAWLRQPGNERHCLRVILECLKEIGSADLPARVLLGHKVIQLVQRCLSEQADDSVQSLAQHMLQRWRWQLAGHMQVLTHPTYMEDHLAVLDQGIAAGAVPVPQLPKHKQVLLNTPLPSLPGTTSGRFHHTPQHPGYDHQQQQGAAPGSAPPALHNHAAAQTPALDPAAFAGLHGLHNAVSSGLLPPGLGVASQGFEGVNPAVPWLLNPAQLGTPGFSTPANPTVAALFRSGSPALAPAPGSNGIQHLLLQTAAGSITQAPLLQPLGQPLAYACADPAVSAGDAYALAGTGSTLGPLWPAGLPASAGLQFAAGSGVVPVLHTQQQQLLVNPFGLQQQQQYLQSDGLAAAAAAAAAIPGSQGLLQPEAAAQAAAALLSQQQPAQQQWQQQWLGVHQLSAAPLNHQQQAGVQQAAWQGLAGIGGGS